MDGAGRRNRGKLRGARRIREMQIRRRPRTVANSNRVLLELRIRSIDEHSFQIFDVFFDAVCIARRVFHVERFEIGLQVAEQEKLRRISK